LWLVASEQIEAMNDSLDPNAAAATRNRWQRVGDDAIAGARASAPVLRRSGQRIGDFLVSIGWLKFFLLAILALMLGAMLGEAFFTGGPMVVVDRGEPRDRVQVEVSIGPDGVRIQPGGTAPEPPLPPKPLSPPAPPLPPVPSAAKAHPSVQITEAGVQIVTQRDGQDVTVAIDGSGVRVTQGALTPSAADAARVEDNAVVIPPSAVQDPEKLAEAVEAARGKIEEIVASQVERQVARSTGEYREQSKDGLMSFIFLLIVTAVIVKIVLGSKKKAEVRAQAASATAAEEGLKRQLAEAQLKMMQAQVEPHFLFNTLASVDYLIETDPVRASKMQKNLIQYLRSALPQMREGSTTLGKEIALCRAYLEILKVRMDERLQFAITVPQGLGSAQFPPMMLQSLVENAIKHGLEPKAEGGSLTIGADVAYGTLRVTVADTGLGFGAAGTAGDGVGLANVRERLTALYGAGARLTVDANTPSGTISTIEVPYALDAGAAPNGRNSPPPGLAPQPA
jgi:hypothetical protein